LNAADEPARGSVYLTVTGTSAEAGDDGEVGRGNRVNGLITPGRPMTLEAAAGKNPVSHVGKLYNVAAGRIAQELVATVPGVAGAECALVSQIGAPLDEPHVVSLRLRTADGRPASEHLGAATDIVRENLSHLAVLSEQLVAAAIELY
jgi:S-adenosylmethionine synthetase